MPNSKLKLLCAGSVAGVLALSLSACREDQRQAALPLPATAPMDFAFAPPPMELPYAPPAQLGRLVADESAYAWAERAYALDEAFYDERPDYGFAYDEVQPWVWEEDDWRMYAEPVSDGYRFYYYEPEATYPYFIRDDRYGYGFDDTGRLVTLYDVAGQLLSTALLGEQAPVAGRYLAHALLLSQAAERAPHFAVQEPYWEARAPILVRSWEPWSIAAWQAEPWIEYRTRSDHRELKQLVKDERKRERVLAKLDRAEPVRRGWDRSEAVRIAEINPRETTRGEGDKPGRERQHRQARPERQVKEKAPRAEERADKGRDERAPRQVAKQEQRRASDARAAEQHAQAAVAKEDRGGRAAPDKAEQNRAPKGAEQGHGGEKHGAGGGGHKDSGGGQKDTGPKGGGGGDGKGGGKDR